MGRLFGFETGNKLPHRRRQKGKVATTVAVNAAASSSDLRNAPNYTDQYLIVHESETMFGQSAATATPVFWTCDINDEDLLNLINRLPSSPDNFTDVNVAKAWALDNDFMIITSNKSFNTVGGDLVLYFDVSSVDCWPGSGNKLYDLSGNGNYATLYNSPLIEKGYIEWNGTNEYAQISFDSSMAAWNTAQTVCMWLNHSYTSGRRNPWDQAYGGYGTWTHEQGESISHYYGDAGRNASPYVGRGSGAPGRNQWNFVVTTRSTTQSKWYVNGTNTDTYNHSYGTLTTDTNVVRLARGYAGYWQGRMGSVMAYSKVLTQAEILQNYYLANIVTDNLQLHYDFGHFACYDGESSTIYNLAVPASTGATIVNTGNDITYSKAGYIEWAGNNAAYVDIPDTGQMGNFSLSAWVYNKSGGDGRHSLLRNFWEIVGTSLQFWSYDFANDYWRSTASNIVPYDTWTHITTTWDGSVVRHYANGGLVWVDSNVSSGTSENLYWMGGYGGRKFKGKVAVLSVYQDTLTGEEVFQNYNAYQDRFK
jgi:hypothetical protein